MEKQEFVQKYPGDNLKAKEWNSLIECVNQIIDEVNSNSDIISSNDENNNVEIKSGEGDIVIHSNGTSEQNDLNKIRFLHNEGLEFGTFDPKETSIYTNEYHFKKNGVIKLATRQENTLNGEVVSYESNVDKSYDDINPLDPQVTWNDILTIINNIKTSNISWSDIETAIGNIKNSPVTWSTIESVIGTISTSNVVWSDIENIINSIKNSDRSWNLLVSTTKYIEDVQGINLKIDPSLGIVIEDIITPGHYLNGIFTTETTLEAFNNNLPSYGYVIFDCTARIEDITELPVLHASEIIRYIENTSPAAFDAYSLFSNLYNGDCVAFKCKNDRVLLGTKKPYNSFAIKDKSNLTTISDIINNSNNISKLMTFGSFRPTYKFSVNVPGFNNTIDEDDQPYSTSHFYSPLTLTWFNSGLDTYYYNTYGKHIPLYDLSYINADRFRVLDDYGNTTNIGQDMSAEFLSDIVSSYEPAIDRGDLELTGTLLGYDLLLYNIYQLKDGDYFAIKCMYSAEYGQDYLVWMFQKNSPNVTFRYGSGGDSVDLIDIVKLVNYMKTNNLGPWANV